MRKLKFLILTAVILSLIIAQAGYSLMALGIILLFSIGLLSLSEEGGAKAKIVVTFTLGFTALFIFACYHGIPAPESGTVLEGFHVISHTVHLNIFIFLFGLYLFVNCISYSGIIGDLSWRVVKVSKGKLPKILVVIMILTSVLSGVFDGATVASIMGVITLTILLSSGMSTKEITKIMLLLVVCTNVGGVWFVLGEPTNILAAEKMKLSPVFFLHYATPFALIAIVVSSIAAYRIAKNKDRISEVRPELEILLEGVSLKRIHSGHGSLLNTLIELGDIEIKQVRKIEEYVEMGKPDFEAALMAGVPQSLVHDALSINLNSEELAKGLVDYWQYQQNDDPMAQILIGDLLHHVKAEYKKRGNSRMFVITASVVLISLLGMHTVFTWIPTWASTIAGGLLAFIGIHNVAKKNILRSTWHDLREAFFLIALFGVISLINVLGGFEIIGEKMVNMGDTALVGTVIMISSSLLSAVADNIAVMDVITNLITSSEHWQFLSLSAIVGTALGGFCSPIASVQAIILCTLIRRVSKISFGQWIVKIVKIYLVLAVSYVAVLLLINYLDIMPVLPWGG